MTESRKFNPKHRERLNNPIRLELVPPTAVAQHVEMKADGEYVDLGAGTGYLSKHITEAGNSPTVHALDIEPIMVEEMESTLQEFQSIVPTLMKIDELPFADTSVDGLWSITVYHEFKQPDAILGEILRVLKPGGKLLIVDWLKSQEACEQGPPLDHRIAEDVVIADLQRAGFADVGSVDGLVHHFGVVATKR